MSDKKRITLWTYVELLKLASEGKLENVHKIEEKSRSRAAKELLDSGLISDALAHLGRMPVVQDIVITPEGANALAAWSALLRSDKPWMKALKALERVVWLILGVLITKFLGAG